MTSVDREKLIEVLAQATELDEFDGGPIISVKQIDAILDSIRDQGFVIVPREPTDAMIKAADFLDEDHVMQFVLGDAFIREGFGRPVYTAMISSLEEEGNV